MKELLKVRKLDALAIRPYVSLKNIIIAIIPSILSKNPSFIMYISLFFVMIYSSYPFLVGEESGIERMYRIFGIEDKYVVRGRYVWILSFAFILISLAMLLSIIISFMMKADINLRENLVIYLAYMAMMIVLVSLQYPLMFLLEYKSAKKFSMFPMIIIFVLVYWLLYFIGEETLNKIVEFGIHNKEFVVTISILLIIFILFLSIKFSEKFYKKREV